ncbi:Transcriptional regulator TetR family [Patulibacter medicamentivorans]|uniref:Transcriptional regulator TetR family n=1 Tax=Patulibacter medicamentivorans TaxID=1097667 RepID=H0E4W2_9ACTN|nr:TetR/AcrR family transcriptional regulator [Patulibacter medicamentivorans]EHN11279.1 Transcriptional regulator TetR family [Patulibacter medicamentivorans]
MLSALEVMLESTRFTDIRVEHLAREAEMSRATFYVYFEDKGTFLSEVAESAIGTVVEAGRYWWSLGPDLTKGDLREALERIADAYRSQHRTMAAVIEAASYDSLIGERFADLMKEASDGLAAYIRTGQREGFIHADIDPDASAVWLAYMAERGFAKLVTPADAAATESLMATLTDLVWNALHAGLR